ncbi:NADPH:quinone reductase [Microbacterium testaceum StLB037]|uniref:NADPH:quinone reductase n=1 Tax=Microbacterium testaceum (strain StLB037) TaxID=979556 RepID=A0A1H0KTS8_MICTS|nr:NADP-dependent oxidoreductase [Microbacterium testaceum]SDO59191.1 NADPH:quinone reductase [Microbacterium testaceum StLB037]
MKAMRFHEVGGPDVLRLDDVELPTPGPGQVRLMVAASAFNAADNGMRAGFLPIPVQLPHVPGYDVSGTIDAVGAGVEGVEMGQAVIGFLPMQTDGGAAEYVLAPADAVTAAPRAVDLVDAAALPSVALTAWQALFDDGGLRVGQRVLIVGAGGAVGIHAVRLAHRAGAHVIATASPRSLDAVGAAGADQIVDRTRASLLDVVDEPVDVLLNLAPLDPDDFAALVGLVRDGGVVVSTTAFMTTPGDERRGVDAKTVFVRADTPRLAAIVALVDAGELIVAVDRRIDLVDLPALHAEAMAGRIAGKVVVVP